MSRLQSAGPTASIREALANSERGMSPGDLRQALPDIAPRRLRGLIDALRRHGQVQSTPDPSLPKKGPRYSLTPLGRAKLDAQRRALAPSISTPPPAAPPSPKRREAAPTIDISTSTSTAVHVKNRERAELARQIEAFIARGGRIERLGNTPLHRENPVQGRRSERHP